MGDTSIIFLGFKYDPCDEVDERNYDCYVSFHTNGNKWSTLLRHPSFLLKIDLKKKDYFDLYETLGQPLLMMLEIQVDLNKGIKILLQV